MKKKGMAKGGSRGGVEELNPGKTVDVTEMANGGYVDDKMVNRMMGGGRPKGMAKGGAMGGLNSAIKRVKAGK